MTPTELITLSETIRSEGLALQKELGIPKKLGSYGEHAIIGSCSYNLMIAKDIDAHVLVTNFTRQNLIDLADFFYKLPQIRTIRITDNSDRLKSGLPAGFYLCLQTESRWKFDIWFMSPDEDRKTGQQNWQTRLTAISNKQRYLILLCKKLLMEMGHKFGPKRPSVTIYEKVLSGEIYDEASAQAFTASFFRE